MVQMRIDDAPFGLTKSVLGQSFVVLDKSFLDAASSAQLQYYVNGGITFVVPEVLPYELMRTRDDRHVRSLYKMSHLRSGLVRLPGIAEMFRAENAYSKPAPSIIDAAPLTFNPVPGPDGPFPLTREEQRMTEERTAGLTHRVHELIEIWRELGSLLKLKKLEELEREIRDDPDSMRRFYGNHRTAANPDPGLIDERWTYFRWVQVYLLAGLDFFRRHGLHSDPNRENLLHEVIDLDYTITALLVGGLASCERRIQWRFKFLRSDGHILRNP